MLADFQELAQLKFLYLDLKNNFTDDNKYLAMVTDNGLWIKDSIGNNTYIINANEILIPVLFSSTL